METQKIDYKNIFYPPGGILIWILILVELITFGVALIVLSVYSRENPELYHQARLQLNATYGAVNTMFLLTSGYFMAVAVHKVKLKEFDKSAFYTKLAMLGGLLFLALKSVEYYEKIEHGLLMGHNTFFTFYWLLTGFHVIHVLIGLGILLSMYLGMRKADANPEILDVEAGASFWHMCDLIWLLLFPVLYLVF
jgi:nitric oxide reductase NorE protein